MLVQDGTLQVGDVIVCGDGYGRVRALFDDKGRSVDRGAALDARRGLGTRRRARRRAKSSPSSTTSPAPAKSPRPRRTRSRGVALGERQAVTLENLYSKMAEQKLKSLNLILKADVQGSLEALDQGA